MPLPLQINQEISKNVILSKKCCFQTATRTKSQKCEKDRRSRATRPKIWAEE